MPREPARHVQEFTGGYGKRLTASTNRYAELELASQLADAATGRSADTATWTWDALRRTIDLSEPLDHYISCTPGHVSVLLRGHEYFCFGMKRMLSGVEKLVGLGHPRDLDSGSVTYYQLSSLAGNTRSVHYLCCEVFLFVFV